MNILTLNINVAIKIKIIVISVGKSLDKHFPLTIPKIK